MCGLMIFFLLLLNYRLQGKFSPVEKILLPGQTMAQVAAHVEMETKTVAELLALDIYKHKVGCSTDFFFKRGRTFHCFGGLPCYFCRAICL